MAIFDAIGVTNAARINELKKTIKKNSTFFSKLNAPGHKRLYPSRADAVTCQ